MTFLTVPEQREVDIFIKQIEGQRYENDQDRREGCTIPELYSRAIG